MHQSILEEVKVFLQKKYRQTIRQNKHHNRLYRKRLRYRNPRLSGIHSVTMFRSARSLMIPSSCRLVRTDSRLLGLAFCQWLVIVGNSGGSWAKYHSHSHLKKKFTDVINFAQNTKNNCDEKVEFTWHYNLSHVMLIRDFWIIHCFNATTYKTLWSYWRGDQQGHF